MLPTRITKRVNLSNIEDHATINVGSLIEVVDQLTPGYEVDEGFVEICPNTCEPILVVSFYREAHWPVK